MLSQEEKHELLQIARKTLSEYLKSGKTPKGISAHSKFSQKRGAFVSLHTKKDALRGCIGLIESMRPLGESVQEMVISAATRDPRFLPVTSDELPHLKIEISVLSPLKKVEEIKQIEVGKHGLIIRQEGYSGLLLPQVATEYGWKREEFLTQTCQKAGLPADAWKKNAEIYCFTAEVFSEPGSGG